MAGMIFPVARGCTPQSCGLRDRHSEFHTVDAGVFGLSAQSSVYQREIKQRLHMTYDLLSDSKLLLASTLSLPTFEVADMVLYRRLTIVAVDGRIEKVFYPVFPPGRNAEDVISWLRNRTS